MVGNNGRVLYILFLLEDRYDGELYGSDTYFCSSRFFWLKMYF